jgi:hypothetical protein
MDIHLRRQARSGELRGVPRTVCGLEWAHLATPYRSEVTCNECLRVLDQRKVTARKCEEESGAESVLVAIQLGYECVVCGRDAGFWGVAVRGAVGALCVRCAFPGRVTVPCFADLNRTARELHVLERHWNTASGPRWQGWRIWVSGDAYSLPEWWWVDSEWSHYLAHRGIVADHIHLA